MLVRILTVHGITSKVLHCVPARRKLKVWSKYYGRWNPSFGESEVLCICMKPNTCTRARLLLHTSEGNLMKPFSLIFECPQR